jgi:hypothetical protein
MTSSAILRSLLDFFASSHWHLQHALLGTKSSSSLSTTLSRETSLSSDSDTDTEDIEGNPTTKIRAVVKEFLKEISYPSYTISSIPRAVEKTLVQGLITLTTPWIEQTGGDIAKWTKVCHQSAAMADVSIYFPSNGPFKLRDVQMAYKKQSHDVKAQIALFTWSVS